MDVVTSHGKAKALRLIAIANELLAIAKLIDQDEPEGAPLQRPPEPKLLYEHDAPGDHPLWGELARDLYRSRRRREKIFANGSLFGEPAWDILLDLFIAAKENRRVSVMSACIGAAVPSTTALRWIAALERENLVLREDDPLDARRTFVQLSSRGYGGMVEYFAASAKTIKSSALARLEEFERAERAAEHEIVRSEFDLFEKLHVRQQRRG